MATPDDKFQINTYVDVKATRSAPLGERVWNTRLIWKNLITGARVLKRQRSATPIKE